MGQEVFRLVKFIRWLIAAEVIFEPKLQRVHHHFQRKQDRGLNGMLRNNITPLKFPGVYKLEDIYK